MTDNSSNISQKINGIWPDRIKCLYRKGGELQGVIYHGSHSIDDTICSNCSLILDPDYHIEKYRLKKCFFEFKEKDNDNDFDLPFANKISLKFNILIF